MTDKIENPPAFPEVDGGRFYRGGMTLRDYFAGQALAGILSYPDAHLVAGTASQAAGSAYQIADAMLAARKGDNSHE